MKIMKYEEVEANSERWFDLTLLLNEEFRDIENYEGLYQISNYGRVKSLKRKTNVCLKNNTKRVVKERILKNSLHLKSRGPHYRIKLSKENKTVMIYIHRLIAEAFIPNPNNHPIVNHIDGNALNNMADNLEWCTIEHNVRHAFENGLIKIRKGTKSHMYGKSGSLSPNSKKVNQYTKEGIFIKTWESINLAEKTLNIKNISTCCQNKRKTSGGYIWKYKED